MNEQKKAWVERVGAECRAGKSAACDGLGRGGAYCLAAPGSEK